MFDNISIANRIGDLIDTIYKAIVFYNRNKDDDLIDQEDLKHIYVAGGALVNTIRNESHIKDFDLYFDDEAILNKYIRKFEEMETPFGKAWHKSQFAYSCQNGSRLSFIHKFVGPPDKIAQTFDWKHCQVYSYITDDQGERLNGVYPNMNGVTKDCIMKGHLRAHHFYYPALSMMRAIKKLRQGWTINQDSWEFLCKKCAGETVDHVHEFIHKIDS